VGCEDVLMSKFLLDELAQNTLHDFVKSYGRQVKQSGRAGGGKLVSS
jgi:hypothetical protein